MQRGLKGRQRRRGGILVLMVLMLPVAVLMSAFAINVAYLELAKTEMIIATDAATRAGGRDLIRTDDMAVARSRAQSLAFSNRVGGKGLRLSNSDIVFGQSTRSGNSRYNFSPSILNPNALQVTAHRDAGNLDGAVSLIMPAVLGKSSVPVTYTATSTQMEVDVSLVIDRSGSMAFSSTESSLTGLLPITAPLGWDFGQPAPPLSRWLNLVSAVNVFTSALTASPGSELLSLSSYNSTAVTDVPLTASYGSVLTAMNFYTASFQTGATNVGGGIAEGEGALRFSPAQRTGAAKVMIVMTDGIHNTGLDPIIAAQSAADKGMMIFTVTFADEADQVRMQQVATIGSGKHYHASTPLELQNVFRDIAQSLPTLLTR